MQRAKESDGEYNSQFLEFPVTLFAPPNMGFACLFVRITSREILPTEETIQFHVKLIHPCHRTSLI